MRIRPNENFSHASSANNGASLDKTKVYEATVAVNQPDYIRRGLVFVSSGGEFGQDYLLDKTEYTVVSKADEILEDIRQDFWRRASEEREAMAEKAWFNKHVKVVVI